MGFHNIDSDSDGVVDADVDTASVTTTALTDAADSGEWETLKDLGFEQGEFVPFGIFSTRTDQTFSTTSSSYVDAYQVNEFIFTQSDFPSQLHYRANYRAQPNGDTMYVQLWNDTDSELVSASRESVTASSWTNFDTGVQTYDPPTTNSPIAINPQIRNSNGSTSVVLAIAQVEIGVTL